FGAAVVLGPLSFVGAVTLVAPGCAPVCVDVGVTDVAFAVPELRLPVVAGRAADRSSFVAATRCVPVVLAALVVVLGAGEAGTRRSAAQPAWCSAYRGPTRCPASCGMRGSCSDSQSVPVPERQEISARSAAAPRASH